MSPALLPIPAIAVCVRCLAFVSASLLTLSAIVFTVFFRLGIHLYAALAPSTRLMPLLTGAAWARRWEGSRAAVLGCAGWTQRVDAFGVWESSPARGLCNPRCACCAGPLVPALISPHTGAAAPLVGAGR